LEEFEVWMHLKVEESVLAHVVLQVSTVQTFPSSQFGMIVTPQLAEMVALSHGFDCVVD